MAASKNQRSRPARTPAARENQLIAMAMDLAEEQLRNKTAPASVITHFLKLGSTMNELEIEKLKHETALLEAKRANLESSARSEQLFEAALKAFKTYSGGEEDEDTQQD